MLVLITYDIPDNKRRTKLATFLEGYGRRVQKSVFECFLTQAEMQELHRRIQRRVNPDEDNVRFYWLTPQSVAKSLAIGSDPPTPPPNVYII
ncbi:CRISPR-associated endoribonuclease Cas2 3 [Halomicronema hongdechloris C2206]|uniref:CRISPR-associated endoribonuclease Cas2 n=1 Tax=Halomicronema hongdechloris C2206 TaxID=1641165 RepID=A0A1Z3HHV9_9CYAN|nr:CRISPR-associated endonuclease Cas2 [Halomicronema hongdechloris]ASC69875.1 CRISPR-associated endoribonuclease Cas2 3 [Halomicronema hongdechloris C2206]